MHRAGSRAVALTAAMAPAELMARYTGGTDEIQRYCDELTLDCSNSAVRFANGILTPGLTRPSLNPLQASAASL